MIRFSIIIPHKNIPDLLRRCLDSIPKRDDIQVIVVDDNSDPEIVDFNHFYGSENNSINGLLSSVYFTKEGKGAGYARNVGLKHVLGEWVIFADADDYFTEDFNNVLNYVSKQDDSDLVYFNVESRYADTLNINTEVSFVSQRLIDCINIPDKIRCKIEVPWGKAVRYKLIIEKNLQFDEIYCCNDAWFSVLVSYYAKKISIIDVIGYCWITRYGSISRYVDARWKKCRFNVNLRLAWFMATHMRFPEMLTYIYRLRHYIK